MGGNKPTGPKGSGGGRGLGRGQRIRNRRRDWHGAVPGEAQHGAKPREARAGGKGCAAAAAATAPNSSQGERLRFPPQPRGTRRTPAPGWGSSYRSSSRLRWRAPSPSLSCVGAGERPRAPREGPSSLMAGGRVGRVALLAACGLLAALAVPGGRAREARSPDRFRGWTLPVRRSGRAGHLAGPDRGVEGRDRAHRSLWASVAGSQRPPDPIEPRQRLLRLLEDRRGRARCRSPRSHRAADSSRRPRLGGGHRAAAVGARAPGSRTPPTSPTSCRRSPHATRGASTPMAPARRRRSLRCRRCRSGMSPTSRGFLTPQYEGTTAVSPAHYREMLNAAYSAVKAVDPKMLVVTAGAAPYGDPPPAIASDPCSSGESCSACTPVEEEEAKKKKKAPRSPFVRTADLPRPGEVRRLSPTTRSTPAGARGDRPSTRTTPPARTWIGSCACCAAPSAPGRCCRVGIRSGRPRAGGTATRRTRSAPLGLHARWIEQALYLLWKDGASVVINL